MGLTVLIWITVAGSDPGFIQPAENEPEECNDGIKNFLLFLSFQNAKTERKIICIKVLCDM